MRKFKLCIDLSWQDHHEHLLFVAAEHMLHKSPPRADQDYCEEQESTLQVCLRQIIHQRHGFEHLQKMSDIVQDCPRLFVYAIGSNLGVVDLNITDKVELLKKECSLWLTPWKNKLRLFRKTSAAMIQCMRKTWNRCNKLNKFLTWTTCSVPFFLRMKTQKQPERKNRIESIWYRAGRGISLLEII